MQTAEVWLNGEKIAENFCGYLPFTLDLSKAVRHGSTENFLVVRLDNRDNPQVPPGKPQRELDFTYFGGLYRNVKLIVMDRLHISDPMLLRPPTGAEDRDSIASSDLPSTEESPGAGIFAAFPRVSTESAEIEVRAEVWNENTSDRQCVIFHELLDSACRSMAHTEEHLTLKPFARGLSRTKLIIQNPRLWHPNHPNLYSLHTRIVTGHELIDEQSSRIGIRHIRFDKDAGFFINGERFLSIGANRHQDHPYVGYAIPDNQHWRDVKKLREAGFTSVRSHYPQSPAFMDACDELGMLAIVSNPGWQFMGDALFQQRVINNARRMVRRDRNRPSVVLWEAALNESDNSAVLANLQLAIHEEYPGDQCYTAGDREEKFLPNRGQGWDVEYLHNDGSKPYWIREWGDHVDNWADQQSRSRVRRGWGETPMLIQANSHLSRLDQILNNSARLGGACLWAGIDCQRGYHHDPFYGGPLDPFRLPKFNYYFFQSQRPADIHIPGLDDGPMVFIANFATFLSPTRVIVFSNCHEVALLLDGQQIGRKYPDSGHAVDHPPFSFDVDCFAHEQSTMYMTGVAQVETPPRELIAQGIIDGKVVATHVVRPPGVAHKLMLSADLCGRSLIADGSDWIRIHARICDARGTLCPLADDLIEFSVTGPAMLVDDRRIAANPVSAEGGIATALLQSGTTPGRITVTATAFGLSPARIEIISVGS